MMDIPPLPPRPPVAKVYEFPPVANIYGSENSEKADIIQLRPIRLQPTRICLPMVNIPELPYKTCPRCNDTHYRYNSRFKCYSCGFIELDVSFKQPSHYTDLSKAFRKRAS